MENKRKYEGLFIIDPEKEGSMDEVKTSIYAVIKDNEGSIDQDEVLGKKTLAYPFDKKNEGVYCVVNFSADPEKINKMTSQFKITDNILRTVITLKK
ncbi:MAG: 30S ribosomal protein S6 [Candidatus Omnitrophica bacterium]|nr:30S ribosomal protein S6 [Candidatus Omnitrophota bacterium]